MWPFAHHAPAGIAQVQQIAKRMAKDAFEAAKEAVAVGADPEIDNKDDLAQSGDRSITISTEHSHNPGLDLSVVSPHLGKKGYATQAKTYDGNDGDAIEAHTDAGARKPASSSLESATAWVGPR